jgi:hypothetical protein
MPRETKADRILSAAKERMDVARSGVETAEGQLGIARATFSAHEQAYYALLRELTPKPRKKAEPKQAAKPAENGSKPAKEPMCGVCHQPKDHDDHRVGEYLSAHEFEPPKAGRKAKQKPVGVENTSALAVGGD